MRLSLYIRGRLADLSAGGDDALILWTYSREDAESPAVIRNAYTKTVTLPATEANDTIFSNLYREDHNSGVSGVFDPLARTPFVIYAETGEVLERGYLKLDRVLRASAGPYSYECTLYGGMGSLFYNLMYNPDGSKRTLVGMRWLNKTEGGYLLDETDVAQRNLTLYELWHDLDGGEDPNTLIWPGIVNFVPCHNGIPSDDFDPGLAYYKSATTSPIDMDGIQLQVQDGTTTYQPSIYANGGVVLNLDTRATEWEAQDFRDYLQRPAVSMARLISSIAACSEVGYFADNPGDDYWRLVLDDPDFFQSGNPDWWNTWVTLPMTDKAIWNGANGFRWYMAFNKSLSPAEYLLGFAKMFGLVFVPDPVAMTVTLMRRERYFANGNRDLQDVEIWNITDLSGRVSGDPEFRPYLMTSRNYLFDVPLTGTFAEKYEQRYGRRYGSFRLDTSYGFDATDVEVMQTLSFKGAADVRENSPFFCVIPGRNDVAPPIRPTVKFTRYGTVTYDLYAQGVGTSRKMTVEGGIGGYTYAVPALPQFHDEAGKPTDGDHVMLYFLGSVNLPTTSVSTPKWHISQQLSGSIRTLSGGKDFWNISPAAGVQVITKVPWFRRWWDAQPSVNGGDWSRGRSLDFGDPAEIASGDSAAPDSGVYVRRWQAYLSDRYNRDSTVMTVRVDLTGLQVDAKLLRRFFWYRNAVWSLNRIVDYNPARPGAAECEFVRVQSLTAYTGLSH